MKNFITNLIPHSTNRIIDQSIATDWLSNYHKEIPEETFKKYSVKEKYISSRAIYADGIADLPIDHSVLYALDEVSKPKLSKRSEFAQKVVEQIFIDLYKDSSDLPDHLNHVSCTHYQSPSAAQLMINAKESFKDTTVTHLYHMGCYAALPALRVSNAFLMDEAKHVDVVHTELCSMHLDKDQTSVDQIIMKTLFADGAIKYSVTNEDKFKQLKKDGMEILAKKEVIVPNTEDDMSWHLGEYGFVMTLSKNVPIYIAKRIEQFMRSLFLKANLDYDSLKDDCIFAIHPGGPKIIELVQKILKLEEDQVKHSKEILNTRGNMSSATLPHIWNQIIQDRNVQDNKYIATVAFGPGLTMTGAILKLCRQ